MSRYNRIFKILILIQNMKGINTGLRLSPTVLSIVSRTGCGEHCFPRMSPMVYAGCVPWIHRLRYTVVFNRQRNGDSWSPSNRAGRGRRHMPWRQQRRSRRPTTSMVLIRRRRRPLTVMANWLVGVYSLYISYQLLIHLPLLNLIAKTTTHIIKCENWVIT